MQNLITPKEVATLARPISQGMSQDKIIAYIKEVEQLYVKPILGVEMLTELLGYEDENQMPATIALLLNGDRGFVGLKVAVAYYVWARIVNNNAVNVTRYGIVLKNDEHSQAIDSRSILEIHDQALQYADKCMEEVVAFMDNNRVDYPLFEGANMHKKRKTKTFVIGD